MDTPRKIISAKDPRITEWMSEKIEKINRGKTPTEHDICRKRGCENSAHAFPVCPGCEVIVAVCIEHNPYFMPFDKLTNTQKAEFAATRTILCCRQRPSNPCRTLVPISQFGEIINKPICSFHLGTIIIPANQTKTVLIQMPEGRELELAEDQPKQTQPEKTILIQMPESVVAAWEPKNESDETQPESQWQPPVPIQGKIPNIFEKYTIVAQTPDGKPCGCKRKNGKKNGETDGTTGFKLCTHHSKITRHNFKCRCCDNPSVVRFKNGNMYVLPFCGEHCMDKQVFMCVYGHVGCKSREHEKFYKCIDCPKARFFNCDPSIVPVLETHCFTCHTSKQSSS
jgi:hypothetical protein